MQKSYPMHRLLEGDVGTGKTAIAILVSALVAKQEKQAVIMAPTEILASQHFETFLETLKDFELPIALLTRSLIKFYDPWVEEVRILKKRLETEKKELETKREEQFELKEEITDSITDWIDADDIERIGGAESSYYESLEESYEAKNNLLHSLQELRLIKGIDDDILTMIHGFLTIHSDGKINVNTASKEALISLSEELTGDIADEIIAFRLENPFQQVVDVKNNISISDHVYTEISKFIDIKSNYFSISSTGEINQSRRTIIAIIERSGTKSKIKYWRGE